MAGRGPAPAPQRRRRNADPPRRVLAGPRRTRGPALPADVEWHPRTREWWSTWRRSAQAAEFTETDWSFLLDTALMHHAMWSRQQWTLAAEVRLRVAKFGATPEDRARLRITVEVPAESAGAAAAPAGASQVRKRLRVVD